ncbi:MAG: YdcF family protein [Pseudoxanthomonas sp.]
MPRLHALALGLALLAPATWAEEIPRDHLLQALHTRLFPTVAQLTRDQLTETGRRTLATRAARFSACGDDACRVSAAVWRQDEIAQLAQAAARASDDESTQNITRELQGLNTILNVYGAGAPARYPAIDGPAATPGTARAAADLATALAMANAESGAPPRALDISVALALALIDANDRLDAIAFEPLDGGLNAVAFQFARTVAWPRYRYSAMVVLGAGPDDLQTALSARSKLHLKIAAQRYASGLAPLIILSGGKVHPRGTPWVEAVEMRKALIARYGIPEHAIVIEPYARHTTTNLRNAARLLMRMDAPMDHDVLVVSDPAHIDAVASDDFSRRNLRELGYLPGRMGQRTSPFDIAFRPSSDAWRVDPADPLDP